MYLPPNIKNSYTIGKELRKIKGLRKTDSKAKVIELSPELKAYKEDLQQKGLIVGPIEVALFQTNNGLAYPGFIAKQKINANSVLLRVPVDCLLTTRDAFVSEIQRVFEQHPQFYSKTFSSDWQDRIILTYLLFEYQKGKKSNWYHLLANLPRDIDYVAFWPSNELKYLEDQWVERSIQKQRQKVIKQQQQLIAIARQYPQLFDMKIFTAENITWIHVHLVTRCFGKYFQYTTMVPYAQLFNHQCVDVYYTMAYKQDNPHNPHQQLLAPAQLSQQEQDQAETSDGSYNASDVSCQEQDLPQIEIKEYQIQFPSAIKTQYNTLHSYLCAFINFNDEFSIHYLSKVYQAMDHATKLNQQNGTSLLKILYSKSVKYLKSVKQYYYKIGSNRYSYGLRQRKIYWKNNPPAPPPIVEPNTDYFKGSWSKDKFDQFLMVCGSKDQFQPGSQVYFCYGRLPNRLLLMRYGIALQHNKYNHVFIRINVEGLIKKCPSLEKIIQLQIVCKKHRRFKLKRTVFCSQLLTFFRASFWSIQEDIESIFYIYDLQRQKNVLKLARSVLEQKLDEFSMTIQQNEMKLKDKNVGYHEYFAIVYRLERQRIIQYQIQMLQYAQEIIKQAEKGNSVENILKEEKDKKKLTMQLTMEIYLKSFRHF